MSIETVLGSKELVLQDAHIEESVDAFFSIKVTLLSENPNIDPRDVLGTNLTVRLDTSSENPRYFNGYVTSFTCMGASPAHFVYAATAGPWTSLLDRNRTCRIFREQTRLQTIQSVLEQNHTIEKAVDNPGPVLDYCVQYGESDWAFARRLMETEGLLHFYGHGNGKHALFVGDSLGKCVPLEGYASIPFHDGRRAGGAEPDRILSIVETNTLRATRSSLTDFNPLTPREALDSSEAASGRSHGAGDIDVYEYPGGFEDRAEGGRYAKMRAEEHQSRRRVVAGTASSPGLGAGRAFTLTDHPQRAMNRDYVVTMVRHVLKNQQYFSGGDGGVEPYACTFEAVPADTRYRPARVTPHPRIAGPQTAFVVGKGEVDADVHGRILLRFHWSREGDDSRRVRVVQSWAGPEWGAMALPRVGEEVVVEFEDGDPDRPLVTGMVYNGRSKFPYDPSARGTVTTLKTNSSPGGGGFNELRFDDKAGEEQVFVHAEKDLDIRVGKTRMETIGGAAHLNVTGSEFRRTARSRHQTTGQSDHLEAGQDVHIDAGMNTYGAAGMNYVQKAGMNAHIKAGMQTVIEAGVGLTLKVGGSHVTLTPASIFITAPMVMVNSGGSALSGPGTGPEAPEEPANAPKGLAGGKSKAVGDRAHDYVALKSDSNPVTTALRDAAGRGAPFVDAGPF